jgi:ribosome-associated toxin RatA of RatAB toxin-antitoxin module
MPNLHKEAIVPYTAAQMYALVDNIENYPDFLQWCKGAQVLKRDVDEVHARLDLFRGGIQKSFTTCNRLQTNKMIEMRLLDGPFRHLHGFWQFNALSEASCKVSLDLEFEFSNKLIALAFGAVFHQAAASLVEAFIDRANQIYGKSIRD